jgi:hypothetical protein
MVRDGMRGGSNWCLRRQEKGKMEALCSSSFVGACIGDNRGIHATSAARSRPLNGLKCRKSEIGDIFLFPVDVHAPCMFTFLVAAGAAPWTRGAFPPIGVVSYGHHGPAVLIGCPDRLPGATRAGVDSHGVFADISGILTTKTGPRRRWPGTIAAHGRGPITVKPASGREVFGR